MTVSSPNPDKPSNEKQPWKVLTQFLQPRGVHHQLWWDKLAPVIGSSLSHTGYTTDAQYQSLLLIHSAVIPALGPFPNDDRSNTCWIDAMVNSKAPLDVSINYQKDSKCSVRLTLEPIGPYAGTDADPVNELAAKELLQTLSHIQPGLDFTWLDQLDPMIMKNRDARQHWQSISHLPCKSQTIVGLDLHESSITVKPYLSSLLKAAVTGGDFLQIMFDNLRNLSNIHPDVSLVEDYLSSIKHRILPEKTYLAFDCKSPEHSRIKIYTALDISCRSEIQDLWSLGGQLSGPDINKGLAIVERVWDMIYPTALPSGETRKSLTVNFNWELSPKNGRIAPKAYFLVDSVLDEHVASALASLFKDLGWNDHLKTHLTLVQEVYMQGGADVYMWLAFAYSSDAYITAYINPLAGCAAAEGE